MRYTRISADCHIDRSCVPPTSRPLQLERLGDDDGPIPYVADGPEEP
jgi:hypothetical protein